MLTEHGSRDTGANVQGMDDINAIMALIQPPLDASITEGTKGLKSSLIRYSAMYCAAFRIDIQKFGSNL